MLDRVLASPATAVAGIWICSALAAILAPDMISGSEHEHLPIVAISIWLWTVAATGYALLGARGTASTTLTAGTVAIWVAVLLVTVFAPVMVTGSDPTRIPIAGLAAPAVGALATGFLALHQSRIDAAPAVE